MIRLSRVSHGARVAATALIWSVSLVSLFASTAGAQRPTPARADSLSIRADYRDLDELLANVPSIAPPKLDEQMALWLGTLPLACLDRLQSRTAGRAGAGGRGTDSVAVGGTSRDSARRDSTTRDSAGRGAANPGAANGAGYFWVPSYRLVADHDRLRAFWGCADWHSAVSSTWVAARLLRAYPSGSLRDLTREKLNAHLGKSNLDGELTFFRAAAAAINPIPSASQTGGLFERPYGFAWLLTLAAELRTSPDSQGRRWSADVAPLANWMADSVAAYFALLPKPVRTGVQTNSSMSLLLALNYADGARDEPLRQQLAKAARRFYNSDRACETQLEVAASHPSGRGAAPGAGLNGDSSARGRRNGGGGGRAGRASDFPVRDTIGVNDLTATSGRGPGGGGVPAAAGPPGAEVVSPCLTEAATMARVLDPPAFIKWIDAFLPPLESGRFAILTEPVSLEPLAPGRGRGGAPVAASPATPAERARLSGLSFERAYAMEIIARALPTADPRVNAWRHLAAIQANRGIELMRGDTVGSTWLPAYALLYFTMKHV